MKKVIIILAALILISAIALASAGYMTYKTYDSSSIYSCKTCQTHKILNKYDFSPENIYYQTAVHKPEGCDSCKTYKNLMIHREPEVKHIQREQQNPCSCNNCQAAQTSNELILAYTY